MKTVADLFEIQNNRLIKYKGNESFVFIPDNINVEVITSDCFSEYTYYSYKRKDREVKPINYIRLPNGLKKIEQRAFSNLDIKEIVIPPSVTEIGENAFYLCQELEKVTLPRSLTKISAALFEGCAKLKEVIIESDSQISSIEKHAFNGCSSLTKITIPDLVTTIFEGGFLGCINLVTLNISYNSKLTTIKKEAFSGCSSLVYVYLDVARNLSWIEEDAFAWCKSITYLTLPKSLKYIGDRAFMDSHKLTSVTIYQGCHYHVDHNPFTGEEVANCFPLGCKINVIYNL